MKGTKTRTPATLTSINSLAVDSNFDPLLLLKGYPSVLSSAVEIREGPKSLLSRKFDHFFGELRGSFVVLFDPENEDGGEERMILAMFSAIGTDITLEKKEIRMRKYKDDKVTMKFSSPDMASQWFQALEKVSKARVVGLSDFQLMSPIGKGASGKVFMVRDKKTKENFALKSITKESVYLDKSYYRHMVSEHLAMIEVLGLPFFVQLRYAFQTRKNFYLVLQFCKGGDVFQYLRNHDGRMSPESAKHVLAEVVYALELFHQKRFIFRDLKPENVLIDEDGHISIGDFGLAKKLKMNNAQGMTSTVCGTANYAAPEMLNIKDYGRSIDFWALGIFAYHILHGRTPFESEDIAEIMDKMKLGPLEFSPQIDDDAISFIKGLLNLNPEARLGCGPQSMAEVKNHPYFKGTIWSDIFAKKPYENPLFDKDKKMVISENFDLDEWSGLTNDDTEEDKMYGDQSMYPIQYVKQMQPENNFLIGFTFDYNMC